MTTQTAPYGTGRFALSDPRHPRYLQDADHYLRGCAVEMQQASKELNTLRAEQRILGAQLEDLAAEERFAIACETNGNGKARYANAEQRADVARLRLVQSPAAKQLRDRLAEIEIALAERQVSFDTARRQRQNQLGTLTFAGQWLGYHSYHSQHLDDMEAHFS